MRPVVRHSSPVVWMLLLGISLIPNTPLFSQDSSAESPSTLLDVDFSRNGLRDVKYESFKDEPRVEDGALTVSDADHYTFFITPTNSLEAEIDLSLRELTSEFGLQIFSLGVRLPNHSVQLSLGSNARAKEKVEMNLEIVDRNNQTQWWRKIKMSRDQVAGKWQLVFRHGEATVFQGEKRLLSIFFAPSPSDFTDSVYILGENSGAAVRRLSVRGTNLSQQETFLLTQFEQRSQLISMARASSADCKWSDAVAKWRIALQGWSDSHNATPVVARHQIEFGLDQIRAGSIVEGCNSIAKSWPSLSKQVRDGHPWKVGALYEIREALESLGQSIPAESNHDDWQAALSQLAKSLSSTKSLARGWQRTECDRVAGLWKQAMRFSNQEREWLQSARNQFQSARREFVAGNAKPALNSVNQVLKTIESQSGDDLRGSPQFQELHGDVANLAATCGFVAEDLDIERLASSIRVAEEKWKSSLPLDHPKQGLASLNRASLQYLRGDWPTAKQNLLKARDRAAGKFGAGSPEALRLQTALGRIQQWLGEDFESQENRLDCSWRYASLTTAGVIPRSDQIVQALIIRPKQVAHPTLAMIYGAAAPGPSQLNPFAFHSDSAALTSFASQMEQLVDPFFEHHPWPGLEQRLETALKSTTAPSSFLRTFHPFDAGMMSDRPLANLPAKHLWRVQLLRNAAIFDGAQPPPPIPKQELDGYTKDNYTHLLQSLRQGEVLLGKDHPDVGLCYEIMAVANYSFGRLDDAARFAKSSDQVLAARLGRDNPRRLAIRNTLGILHYYRNRLADAFEILSDNCQNRIAKLGETDPATLQSMNDTAVAARAIGEYDLARRLLESAIKKWPNVDFVGLDFKKQFQRRTALTNHCVLLAESGDYLKAEHRFLQLLNTAEETQEKQRILICLSSLAIMKSDFKQAENYLTRAKSVDSMRPNDPQINHSLGIVYRELGDFDRASKSLNEALNLRTQNQFVRPSEIGDTLTSIGLLEQAKGNFSKALEHFLSAAKSYDERLGGRGLKQADTKRRLALAAFLMGRGDLAIQASEQALDAKLELAREMASSFSDAEALLFSKTLTELEPLLSSLATDRSGNAERALEAVWKRKAIVAQLMQQRQRTIVQSKDPELAKKQLRLREIRHTLSTLLGSQFTSRFQFPRGGADEGYFDPDERARRVAELTDEKESLQREIASIQPAVLTLGATDCQTVGKSLRDGEILLEFVKVGVWPRTHADNAKGSVKPIVRYQMFALLNEGGETRVIWDDLGDAKKVDELVSNLRRLMKLQVMVRRGLEIVDEEIKSADPTSIAAFTKLIDEQLLSKLFQSNHVYLVPDGSLHGVPWAAIRMGDRHLIESASLSLLDRGTDLTELKNSSKSDGDVLLVGDVSYGQSRGDATSWDALAGAVIEMKAIDEILGKKSSVARIEKDEATERVVVDRLPSTRLAHFATHGFFTKNKLSKGVDPDWRDPMLASAVGRNPLSRCGLVLSGANRLPKLSESGVPIGSDGLLTAEELCDLDLRSLKLVVLSACETGLGEVADNEGTFGLHRALSTAGASSTIGSLWQVSDDATTMLMKEFYSQLANGNLPIAQALRQAQIKLLRRKDHFEHPFYWAAFVSSGDTRARIFDQ